MAGDLSFVAWHECIIHFVRLLLTVLVTASDRCSVQVLCSSTECKCRICTFCQAAM